MTPSEPSPTHRAHARHGTHPPRSAPTWRASRRQTWCGKPPDPIRLSRPQRRGAGARGTLAGPESAIDILELIGSRMSRGWDSYE